MSAPTPPSSVLPVPAQAPVDFISPMPTVAPIQIDPSLLEGVDLQTTRLPQMSRRPSVSHNGDSSANLARDHDHGMTPTPTLGQSSDVSELMLSGLWLLHNSDHLYV